MSTSKYILPTTIDNPYSPFTDWSKWHAEDVRLGHNTTALIGRLAPPFTDWFDDGALEEAVAKILQYNLSGKHIGVIPEDYNPYLIKENFEGLL